MKLFAILFSFFIIFLISLPCVDGTDSHLTLTTEETTGHATRHNSETDGCSPFCFCSCCSISIVIIGFEFDCIPVCDGERSQFVEYESLVSRYIPPVWQPPKFS